MLRVLLLEDSPLDAELITERLLSDGLECRVRCVQARPEFELALGESGLDLILADYSLPGFDGLEALDMARARRPEIPFLFVSGYMGEERAIETLKRGATDYVLKGGLERLLPSVRRALREAGERNERLRMEDTLRILSESSLLLSSLDYTTTLARVARLAVPHLADFCVVDVVGDDGYIQRVAVAHADPEKEPLSQRLLGHGPAPGSGHPIWQVLESGQAQLIPRVDPAMLAGIARDSEHAETMRQLGVRSWMLVPLLAEGRALGVMTFVLSSDVRSYSALDVTLAEELARRCAMAVENARLHLQTLDALRGRDEFLAVLSHELRSPLGAILGWVNMLQSPGNDGEMMQHGLRVIERNAKAQVQLIQELLEVSRIVTGRLHLDSAPVSLAEVVSNVLLSMAPAARDKKIELRLQSADQNAPGEMLQVLGDASRLQQVVSNLLSNAIKFTPSGGLVQVVAGREPGRDGEWAMVRVQDSGEGIAPEFLPFVFERFRQADSSSTRRHGGLGLGLAIVRHLAEMHGGTIEAQSPGRGQGATFTLRVPLRLCDPNASQASEPGDACGDTSGSAVLETSPGIEATEADVALGGLKILLVEDDADAREMLAAILRRAGASVTAAASAQQAMDEIGRGAPDVLLSDIGMPGEDGHALLRRVRDWEARQARQALQASEARDAEAANDGQAEGQADGQAARARILAVALTAYASETDREAALGAGFQSHLAKPIEPAALVAAVLQLARSRP